MTSSANLGFFPKLDFREKRWEKALREFERCRVTSGYSIESIFVALNPRGTETLPVQEFAENLAAYCNMDLRDALTLSKTFDAKRKQAISAEDIRKFLSKQTGLTTISSLLKGHPLFPDWLGSRSDFQGYFKEWGAEDGAPNTALVESALLLGPNNRKAGDLQVLYKWIKLHKCLVHVRDSRLLDVCQSIQFMDAPRPGMKIVEQGDTGDAFYIVINGKLDVIIDGTNVGIMTPGMAFGEKALENNAPRAATVTTRVPSKLMVLRASEYKNLVVSAQAKANSEMVEFLHSRCPFFSKVSYARLYYMVKLMTRRAFQPNEKIQRQDEEAGCVCVVMSGKVAITKRIRVALPPDRGLHIAMSNTMPGMPLTKTAMNTPCSAGTTSPASSAPTSPQSSTFLPFSSSKNHQPFGGFSSSNRIPFGGDGEEDVGSETDEDYGLSARSSSSSVDSDPERIRSTLVHIGDISTGQIFGDEGALAEQSKYSYGVIAKSRSEIVFINRKDILGYFQEKILRRSRLLDCTQEFHQDNDYLMTSHMIKLKKDQYFDELKNAALTPSYAGRLGNLQLSSNSRSLSTKSLETHQAADRAIDARIKYQRVAISATLDKSTHVAIQKSERAAPEARRASMRRASCISFLTAKK